MNPTYRTAIFTIEGASPNGDFSIVTAWNPQGQAASDSLNRTADERLRQILRALGEDPVRITGMSPDKSHQEPGWAIGDPKTAEHLAREFDQAAIYRVEAETLKLIDLESGSIEDLGNWLNFLAK